MIFHRLGRSLSIDSVRRHDDVLGVVQEQFADERLIVQREILALEEALEGEVGGVARARGADGARVAADAGARAGIRFVELDAKRRVERPEALRGEILAELLQARLVTDGRMRVRCGRGRLRPTAARLASTNQPASTPLAVATSEVIRKRMKTGRPCGLCRPPGAKLRKIARTWVATAPPR